MKTLKTPLFPLSILVFFFVLFTNNSVAQEAQSTRGQSVYMEVLGNGLSYSLNYDTRFSKSLKGLGGRAGIGYVGIDGYTLTSVPIVVNYLFGHNKHFFEVGAGATLLAASAPSSFGPIDSKEKGSAFLGTMSFGYRLEPTNGGFLFRAGISPIFDRSSFFPFWPQVSFGYAF
ncbi:hypothetical protein [Aquiflexum sp.]|uniref:hypothetical protein n=1 Tax=Aquiflexum sp. TaxID=1872584 RepID=UPI0035946142